MAFIDLSRDLFENVTISLTPTVTYSSGSSAGISGSAYLMPLKSKRIKEIRVLDTSELKDGGSQQLQFDFSNSNPAYDESDFAIIQTIEALKDQDNLASATVEFYANRYLQAVNDAPLDVRFNKNLPIERFEQPVTFATASAMKRHVKNVLMPYYRAQYDDCGFYYRNYHTLNFFTGSNFNTGSVLIYPNLFGTPNDYYTSVDDDFKKDFTLQFWINPRYKNEKNGSFRPGTVFQLPGTLALSLISGSQKDQNGLCSSYKILAQFKHTAEIKPHNINFNSRNYPNDLWITSSFELKFNNWHHISTRWSPNHNNKTCSLLIDGNSNEILLPSSSLSVGQPSSICIGNFYSGNGNDISKFNNDDAHVNEGTYQLTTSPEPEESDYGFDNPLSAEIHEVKFYNSYINDNYIINSGSGVTQKDINPVTDDRLTSGHALKFYLPPYFYPESHGTRKQLYAPEFKVITSSYTPTNNLFAFAAGGKEINLENFTREMIQKFPPRHFHLTTSLDSSFGSNHVKTVDQFMMNKGPNAKRNLTILPNDNGLFNPSYYIIQNNVTGSVLAAHYTGESYNNTPDNYDLIKLENGLTGIADSIEAQSQTTNFNSLNDEIFGGNASAAVYSQNAQAQIKNAIDGGRSYFLSALSELKEDSSNHIAIFNISNLYYGNQIKPGSFSISDASLTGSQGKINMTLKDNGRGAVYRADCLTKQADWNAVGNLFYDEGLLIIKSPHISLFGKDHFETSFKGEHNIHSLVINVPAPRGYFDKSTNPSFVSLPKSENLNDEETETIAITGVNIHDENFNIIMRANLAQPIIKDKSDEFVIRLKMDF